MATIHMDFDSCRSVQSSISTTKEQIVSEITTLTSAINNMVGTTWIAPSATEFQTTYQEWQNTTNQLLEQLAALGTRLGNEITKMEIESGGLSS